MGDVGSMPLFYSSYVVNGVSVGIKSSDLTPRPVQPLGKFDYIYFQFSIAPLIANSFSTLYVRVWYCFKPYGYDVNNFTQNIGGIDSRVGKFSGNFGYYGDNGQLITADNVQIVNEGDKTYYNPATGSTSTVTDWTYDYSDRSYDLTLDTGDKINVTYGDENVTIKEGDTIYHIYYMTQGGGGSTDPTPTPGPTCTAVGTLKKTCTLCNETKTENIPATGHKWEVLETVETEYHDTGQVIKEGYTVYKCSVCGQEYKDTEGTGPRRRRNPAFGNGCSVR